MTSNEIYLRDFNTLDIYLNSAEVSMIDLSMNATTLNLSASQIILNANRLFKINSSVFFKNNLTISKDASLYTANLLNDSLQFSGTLVSNTSYNVSNISHNGYIYNFPAKSGTIATVADIKSYYTHYITLYRTSYFYISFQITNTTSTKYNSLSAVAKAVSSIAPYDIAANVGIPCMGIIKGNNSTTLSIPVNLYSDENMTSLQVNTCGVINSNGGNISAHTSAYTISATYTVIQDLVK